MKITRSSKIRSLILSAALGLGLAFVSPVSAQESSCILDLNGKGLTDLGTLAGGNTYATGINDASIKSKEPRISENLLLLERKS